MSTTNKTKCPGCGGSLRQETAQNALSRYCSAYICESCGTREAFEGFFWRSNAIAAGLLDKEIGVADPVIAETRKGLIVDVLKPARGDSSNGGFSSSFERLTLVGPGIPEIFEVSDKCPAVVLKLRWGIGGKLPQLPTGTTGAAPNPYVHAEPGYPVPTGERGWQFGGCAIYTSDSRFPFDYPIKLHDRSEQQS